ncbi:MAG: hypothetical protein ACTHU0_25630 [Kofleriaceae bacterium]
MKIAQHFSMILALALTAAAGGCATDAPDDGGDGGGGDGGGGGGGGTEEPVDASGSYKLRSKFDLATNAPGAVGDVVNAIIAATDDPDDPTAWILDQAIGAMPSGTLKTLLVNAKPFVAGYLNDRLLDLAPDFVSTMVQVSNDFGQLAKNFGLNEKLEVSRGGIEGESYLAIHTVNGAHFKIDHIESDHAFADYGLASIVVDNVGVTLDDHGKLGISSHQLAVSYGKVLRIGLDAAIIPLIDPGASNLAELMASKVDCVAVGDAIADAIGFGGASTFASACSAGLVAGAGYIYDKISAIDSTALQLGITGAAKALDKDGNGTIDTIQTGTWSGDATYAGSPAPLSDATFYGSRL